MVLGTLHVAAVQPFEALDINIDNEMFPSPSPLDITVITYISPTVLTLIPTSIQEQYITTTISYDYPTVVTLEGGATSESSTTETDDRHPITSTVTQTRKPTSTSSIEST